MSRAEKVISEVCWRGMLVSTSPLTTEFPGSVLEGLGSGSWGWEWGFSVIKNKEVG